MKLNKNVINNCWNMAENMRQAMAIVLLFVATLSFGQSVVNQIGYVYRYNGKNPRTPLGKVYIKVSTSSNGVLSDSVSGKFTLQLKGISMGSSIGNVQVQKRGMMIFNQQAVDEWNVRKEPLRLILCDADEFEKQKQNLIAIGYREAKKNYDKKVAEIEKKYKAESSEWYQKLSEADEELQNVRKHMSEYADLFARIDESEVDTLSQQAIMLFNEGRVEEAIALFEKGNYLDKIKKDNQVIRQSEKLIETAEEAKNKAISDRENHIQSVKAQFNAYKINNEWDKAKGFAKSFTDEMNDPDIDFDYAAFCYFVCDYKEAEEYYYRIIESDAQDDLVQRALNNLGLVYWKTHEYDKCEEVLLKTLNHRLNNNHTDSIQNKIDIAKTMGNLGNMYLETNNLHKSLKMFEDALEIFLSINSCNDGNYDDQIARTYGNIGLTYMNLEMYEKSEENLIKSIKMYENLGEIKDDYHKQDYARNISNLGALYALKKDYAKSEEELTRALNLQRILVKENATANLVDEARTLLWIANLFNLTQRATEAEAMYKESLELYNKLAKGSPIIYDQIIVSIQHDLAYIYKNNQRFAECEEMFKETINTYRRLVTYNPQTFDYYLALSLSDLGFLYKSLHRFEECDSVIIEAKDIFRRLAETDPKDNKEALAFILRLQAELYEETLRYAESETLYKEALEIYRSFATENPQMYENIASLLSDIASLYYKINEFEKCDSVIIEAKDVYRRLVEISPEDYEPKLASLLYKEAGIYNGTRRYKESEAVCEEVLEIYRRLYANDPQIYKNDLAGILGSLSFYKLFIMKFMESEKIALEALEINPQKNWIASNLAAALLLQGKYEEAEKIYIKYKDELKDSFLDDFRQFEEAGIISKEYEDDVDKIKKILTTEN